MVSKGRLSGGGVGATGGGVTWVTTEGGCAFSAISEEVERRQGDPGGYWEHANRGRWC